MDLIDKTIALQLRPVVTFGPRVQYPTRFGNGFYERKKCH